MLQGVTLQQFCNSPSFMSLRSKILGVYVVSKLALLGFAAVVFADLAYLNQQIEAGLAVADLRRAALEMRRDEKNLFLYADAGGLEHFAQEAAEARRLLREFRPIFTGIVGERRVDALNRLIDDYEAAVRAYPHHPEAEREAASLAIREKGQALYATTREILTRERAELVRSTQAARDMLVVALVAVILIGLVGGIYLMHSVVRPLARLEEGLRRIDAGQAQALELPSADRELRSFVERFNALISHMRAQQAQARRNEKVAALGVLVSGVAHELNNPLSNISTSVQLLAEDEDADPELRRLWLAQIDGETERARRIVKRLLDSVRKPRPVLRPLVLDELVTSALALVRAQLPAAVKVQVEVPAGLVCVADRERMQQVLINLVKNAADAGAQHIGIRAREAVWQPECETAGLIAGDPGQVEAASRAIQLCVEDDGPGIPDAVREQIFTPFFTTKTGGEGTGLGLYLVEEIVAEHGGCVVLTTPPGGGSCFSVWLPVNETTPI